MSKKLVKDESGVALGLAIIMIVLIGVMGAGLLTFVSRDLDAVVQVNQGQKAFELADAGVKAAGRQLTEDCESNSECADHYKAGTPTAIDWSTGENLGALDGSAASPNSATVTIKHQSTSGSTSTFQVTSTGRYADATRRVEAVFDTTISSSGASIPQMVYAPGILSRGPINLNDMSLYSTGTVDLSNGPSSKLNNASMFSRENIYFNYNFPTSTGTDPFGNWVKDPYNTTDRPTTESGMGAVGQIKNRYDSRKPSGMGTRYFDSTTRPKKFVAAPSSSPQPSSEITFPFDESAVSSGPSAIAPDLKDLAQRQQAADPSQTHYVKVTDPSVHDVRFCAPGGSCGGAGGSIIYYKWPRPTTDPSVPSGDKPVVYVEFSNNGSPGTNGSDNRVSWFVDRDMDSSCRVAGGPTKGARGTLVVDKGGLDWQSSNATICGGVIVKDGPVRGHAGMTIRGPLLADGDMELDNGATFSALPDYDRLPGFSSSSTARTKLQSWRELYQ